MDKSQEVRNDIIWGKCEMIAMHTMKHFLLAALDMSTKLNKQTC